MAAKILARIEKMEQRTLEQRAKRETSKSTDQEIREILNLLVANGHDLGDITRRALEPTKDHKLNETLARISADLADLLYPPPAA